MSKTQRRRVKALLMNRSLEQLDAEYEELMEFARRDASDSTNPSSDDAYVFYSIASDLERAKLLQDIIMEKTAR